MKFQFAENTKINFIESLPAITDINDVPVPFNKTTLVQHAIQSTQLIGTTSTPSPSKVQPSPPTITITSTEDGDKSINGMLDRISHDLDFLLNRTMEIPVVRRASGNFLNQQNDQTDKGSSNPLPPPNLSVHEVILEECED